MNHTLNNGFMRKINSTYKVYFYQCYFFLVISATTQFSHHLPLHLLCHDQRTANNHRTHCHCDPHQCSCWWSIRTVASTVGWETIFLLESQSSLPELPYLLKLKPWEIYKHRGLVVIVDCFIRQNPIREGFPALSYKCSNLYNNNRKRCPSFESQTFVGPSIIKS